MLSAPKRYEIDHRTIKLIVGLIAIFLASATSYLSQEPIASISASYHEGGWARNIFVGSLFAISAFMLAYNGQSGREMVLSKVAAIATLGVALFPCECPEYKVPEIIPGVHGISAGVMFLILAALCYTFLRRAKIKAHREAIWRCRIYAVCGAVIVASILVVGVDSLMKHALVAKVPRLIFYGECAGLVAFGIAWLTASRILPFISSGGERFAPWSDRVPDSNGIGTGT